MRPKEVAKKFFTGHAQHLVNTATFHKDEMEDCEKDSPAWQRHKDMMDSATNGAQDCIEFAKTCDKADFGDLGKSELDRLEPTQVSAVIPDAQPTPTGNLRAVYRVGQNPIPAANRTGAGFDFSKLTSIEE